MYSHVLDLPQAGAWTGCHPTFDIAGSFAEYQFKVHRTLGHVDQFKAACDMTPEVLLLIEGAKSSHISTGVDSEYAVGVSLL